MYAEKIWNNLLAVREKHPLVHNLTNYVVMNNTANALLALGAAPVMAHAIDELDEMVKLAGAVVLNIGTLDEGWIASMHKAGMAALALGRPVVLDPVGAGATKLRTRVAARLLNEVRPAVVRGNASEIMALGGAAGVTRGVDSAVSDTGQALDCARQIARSHDCTVVVSGAVDCIISPEHECRIANGHAMMCSVTGLGCTATALIGAFLPVAENPFSAAVSAMAVMGVAGELAAERATGPGSLQMMFLDMLHALDECDFLSRLRLQC